MRDLAALGVGDFESQLGQVFSLGADACDGPLGLELVEATATGHPGSSGRQPFSLLFRGPASPVLTQATYRLESEGFGEIELFLVPLGPADGGFRYEAVFN